jgi:hypothetical protein
LLFTTGFLEFLFNLDLVVARTTLGLVVAAFAAYLILTVLPTIHPDCPYSTPLSPVVRVCVEALARGAKSVADFIYEDAHSGSLLKRWSKNAIDVFDAYSQRSRRCALVACHQERSHQRPGHVFQQMFSGLDESDEIYEVLLSLPAYAKFLWRVGFDKRTEILPLMQQNRHPLGTLLAFFDSRPDSDIVITPPHVQQLTQLMLLVNAAGAQYGRLDIAVEPISMPRVSACLSDSDAGPVYWYFLAHNKGSAVSFIYVSLLSSFYLVARDRCSIDEAGMDGGFFIWRPDQPKRQWFIDDRLILAINTLPRHYRNIYRLLFFIRQILHYRTLTDSPVPSLEHIWRPILAGLHDLAFQSELRILPNSMRAAIWRTIAVVGREDLLPPSTRSALPADAPRLDYTAVFRSTPSWVAPYALLLLL